MAVRADTDFLTVTETPGSGATTEQLTMLATRYGFAAQRGAGKDVVEVACGAGTGLGLLNAAARSVVSGDCSETLLSRAAAHYGTRVPLVRLDAHGLPFRDGSFDVALLFEAIYYLAEPEAFLAEARRILRDDGELLVCTANREWQGFNPSPFSHRYFSAAELFSLLREAGFYAELLGGFAHETDGSRDRILHAARRTLVRLRLVPRTMRGKERLKRLLYRRLEPIPQELRDGMARVEPLTPIPEGSDASRFKVLYAIGRAH